eukprot:2927369-Prorocentrum_lima.AAC.1
MPGSTHQGKIGRTFLQHHKQWLDDPELQLRDKLHGIIIVPEYNHGVQPTEVPPLRSAISMTSICAQ